MFSSAGGEASPFREGDPYAEPVVPRVLREIESPEDPLLQVFYRFYQHAYGSALGRASLESFRALLAQNEERSVQLEFGPLRERIALLLDAQTAKPIGATGYVVYAYPDHDPRSASFAGSCQLHFLCVHPSHRGRGIPRVLLYHVDRRLLTFVLEATAVRRPRVFLTIEQPSEYVPTGHSAADEADARPRLDPFRERRWWARQGYGQLDFPYQRPAHRTGVEACTYLDYFARVPCEVDRSHPSLPSHALLEHLRRLWLVSAGKLACDTDFGRAWHAQRSHLLRRSHVPLR